jgi:hypothetical protein
MTKIELENIISQKSNLQNLPNNALIDYMDKLSLEFEVTKQSLISLTYHLDNVEETYNFILKEYEKRNNGQ